MTMHYERFSHYRPVHPDNMTNSLCFQGFIARLLGINVFEQNMPKTPTSIQIRNQRVQFRIFLVDTQCNSLRYRVLFRVEITAKDNNTMLQTDISIAFTLNNQTLEWTYSFEGGSRNEFRNIFKKSQTTYSDLKMHQQDVDDGLMLLFSCAIQAIHGAMFFAKMLNLPKHHHLARHGNQDKIDFLKLSARIDLIFDDGECIDNRFARNLALLMRSGNGDPNENCVLKHYFRCPNKKHFIKQPTKSISTPYVWEYKSSYKIKRMTGEFLIPKALL